MTAAPGRRCLGSTRECRSRLASRVSQIRERLDESRAALTLLVHSFLDPLLPLLGSPPTQQSHDHHRHVVTPDTARLRIRRQTLGHHVLTDLAERVPVGNGSSCKVDDLLRGETVPDTWNRSQEVLTRGMTLGAAHHHMPGRGTLPRHRFCA